MHFGLFNLMTQRDPKKSARQIYTEMVEQVQMVEQIGFEIAWFAEHHFSNYCLCPSPLSMVHYMAGITKRIKLGPAVIVAPLYEPVRMLEDIAVADNLSDGRLVLGFGSGYQEYEFHKFGVDLKEGRNIFLEKLDLVERFLAGEPFGYQGKLVKVTDTYCRVRPLRASTAPARQGGNAWRGVPAPGSSWGYFRTEPEDSGVSPRQTSTGIEKGWRPPAWNPPGRRPTRPEPLSG